MNGVSTYPVVSKSGASSKVAGTATTLYTSAPDMTLLQETTGGTAIDYVYLNGRPLAMLTGSTFTYLHGDRMGTPYAATNSAQTVLWRSDYYPFGEPLNTSGTATVNLRMPGQYYDAESGFSHNGFRDYVPTLGRYVEADPIGLSGGWNPYSYVRQNPVNWTDRVGLDFRIETTGTVWGLHQRLSVDTPQGPLQMSFGDGPYLIWGNVYINTGPTQTVIETFATTAQEDQLIRAILMGLNGNGYPYFLGLQTCRDWSHNEFNFIKQYILEQRKQRQQIKLLGNPD
jgi:RHS repeat-associated protein